MAIGDSFELREKINELQAARHRRREDTERLQEKLQAANNELAARKEELDTCKRILHEEREKNKGKRYTFRPAAAPAEEAVGLEQRLALQSRGHRQDDTATQPEMEERVRLCIEEQVLGLAMRRSQRNELGIRRFDEKELIVEKPFAERVYEASHIDTVLIQYVPSVERRHSATYRVDKHTTAKKLQEDACLYWGLPEVEYVLRTVENSKLHDDMVLQNCFRKDEQALLVLVKKATRQHVLTEEERLAIRGNKDRRKRTGDERKSHEVKEEKARVSTKDFYQEMATTVPGVYEFMTQRDQHAVEHLSGIRCRNILLYLAWAALTLVSMQIVIPPDLQYYLTFGNKRALTAQRVVETASSGAQVMIPEFEAIQTRDQVWDWLMYSVSSELLVPGSSLRQENYIPGWLQLRMQQVREASAADCGRGTVDNIPSGSQCLAVLYSPATAGTEDFPEVESYWQGTSVGNSTEAGVVGLAGRDPESRPWRYSSASSGGAFDGRYQEFDSSGYYVSYDLQHRSLHDTYEAYLNDTAVLREAGWISGRTRAVSVEFTTYNGNHDYWITSKYLFEMPAAGFVIPLADVLVYRPLLIDDTGHGLLAVDILRSALWLYLIIFQIAANIRHVLHKREEKENLLWRLGKHLSFWMDLCIAGLFLAVVLIREVVLALQSPTAAEYSADLSGGFVDTRPVGKLYKAHVVLEAFLLAALLWRVMTFCRVNRHIYLLWKTMAVTLRLNIRFIWIFLFLLFAFVLWGHELFGGYLVEHRTMWSSCTTILLMLYGKDTFFSGDLDHQRPALFFVYTSCLYLFTHMVVVNVWIASLVSAYQRVRVTSGYRPEDYAWKEWQYAKWCLPPQGRTFYHSHLRPGILREQDDEEHTAAEAARRGLER